MRALIKSYPSIDAVLDIHRDSLPAGKSNLKTAIVDGEKVARVLFVITDDTSGLAHPNWRRNYEFALKLSAQLESMYPGVTRGVAIHKHARFNQQLHDRAIIVEIGGPEYHRRGRQDRATRRPGPCPSHLNSRSLGVPTGAPTRPERPRYS